MPANRKWYRNLAVCETVVEALHQYRKEWRKALDAMSKARLAELAELHTSRRAASES